jgi:DNA-binding XRE family transcriptional regulator
VTLRRVRCLIGPYLTEKKGYPTSPKTVGEMIRKRRLDLGLLQREVAVRIECDTDTVTNWEKGRSTPDLKHVAKLVEFLGINPFDLGDTLCAIGWSFSPSSCRPLCREVRPILN